MESSQLHAVEIRRLQGTREAERCAQVMGASEPWITLRRSYEDAYRMLTDPSREAYLAVVQGQIAGFMILNMKGAFVGYIQTVCVFPEWRNMGLGTGLVGFAEERIFRESPNVFMCVSSFNQKAQRLYERLGYRVVGEFKDYVVRGHAEILLRKTIAPLTEYKESSSPSGSPCEKFDLTEP
jgi:ribosomal-protein-alanine N-acetyltransferase